MVNFMHLKFSVMAHQEMSSILEKMKMSLNGFFHYFRTEVFEKVFIVKTQWVLYCRNVGKLSTALQLLVCAVIHCSELHEQEICVGDVVF